MEDSDKESHCRKEKGIEACCPGPLRKADIKLLKEKNLQLKKKRKKETPHKLRGKKKGCKMVLIMPSFINGNLKKQKH